MNQAATQNGIQLAIDRARQAFVAGRLSGYTIVRPGIERAAQMKCESWGPQMKR